MLYGVAVFPSKHIQDVANSYRKRYDPHYHLIPPHITLYPKEEWDDARLAQVITHLEQIAASAQPFDIHINRYSTFYPVNNVIYMALSDPAPLVKLQDAVCAGTLSCKDKAPYAYTPHITIGQKMNSDELHDVLSSLRNIPLDFTSRVDRIHLLYQMENEGWTVHQTFQFNKASQP
jgi:2'-5' RNA ligase